MKGENGRVIDIKISSSCAFAEPLWTLLGTNGTLRSNGKTSDIRYFDPSLLKLLEADEAVPAGCQYCNEVLPWQEETRPSVAPVTTDFYIIPFFDCSP